MAKKQAFTIDKALYEGREFVPIQELAASMTEREGPLQTAIGPNGCACIKLSTSGAAPGSTLHTSCAPYPTPDNVSQQRIVSVTEKAADFSHSARKGDNVSIDCMVVEALDKLPAGWRDGVYVPLVAGTTYYINYANASQNATGGEMRLQVSFYCKPV